MNLSLRKIEIACFFAGAIVFVFMVRKLGVNEIAANLHRTGWYFGLLIIPSLLSRVFCALSLWFLCRKIAPQRCPNVALFFPITVVAVALRDGIPVIKVGGEVYKGMFLAKYLGARDASNVVVTYNMAYVLGHVLFFLLGLCLAVFVAGFSVSKSIGLASVLVLAVGTLFYLVQFHLAAVLALPKRFLKSEASLMKYASLSKKIVDGWASIISMTRKRPQTLMIATLIYLVGRVIECFELYLAVNLIGFGMQYYQALMVDSLSTLFNGLLFFFPYAAGVKELGLSFLFEQLKYSGTLGIYAAVVNRIILLCWIAIGLVFMALLGIGRKKQKQTRTGLESVPCILLFGLLLPSLCQSTQLGDSRKHLKKLYRRDRVDYSNFKFPHLVVQSATRVNSSPQTLVSAVRSFLYQDQLQGTGHYPRGKEKKTALKVKLPAKITTGKELEAILNCSPDVCKMKLLDGFEKKQMAAAKDKVDQFQKLILKRLQLYSDKRTLMGFESRKDTLPVFRKMLETLQIEGVFPKCTQFITKNFWESKPGGCQPVESYFRSRLDIIRPDKLRPIFRISELFEFFENGSALFFDLYVYSTHYFDSVSRTIEVHPYKKNESFLVVTDIMEIDELVRSSFVRFLFRSQMENAIKEFQQGEIKQIEKSL